jgi:hypothetical protein
VRALWILVGAAGCGPAEHLVGEAGEGEVPTRFGLPVDPAAIAGRIGVDHDPTVQEGAPAMALVCADYVGRPFPHCYDEHTGTDLLLRGGFPAMDAGSVPVFAGADGVVVEAVDGNYDRCHAYLGDVSCDGNPRIANRVILEHPDGVRSKYWHLMKGSVLVDVGDQVTCGTPLGRIGSSGYSSLPHLHFEAEIDGDWVDPFAGPWSQDASLWLDQGSDDGLPGPGCAAADTGR